MQPRQSCTPDQPADNIGGFHHRFRRRSRAAHLHPRALQLERRVDADHDLGTDAKPPGYVEQAGRFPFTFNADCRLGFNSPFKLTVGLAGAGEA